MRHHPPDSPRFPRTRALSSKVVTLLKSLKPWDAVAVLLAVATTAFSAVLALDPGAQASQVVIVADARRYVYPITEDHTITMSGPIGETVIEIKGGKVRVASDPGPRQICVGQGWIEKTDEWLLCLPNKVLVRIAGQEVQGVDGKAY